MVLGKNLESGEQTEYNYNALYMCIGNIQTSGIENDPNRKERIYALDYLSRTNNVLTTVENNAMLDRMVYGREYECLNRRTIDSKIFYGLDLQCSPAVAVDEQGTIMQYVKRNAWGERVYSMSEVDDSFTSYTYDAVIGKYFAQARFYDATKGRMLAQDPVKRGLNPYIYCDNDPVNKTDPTGEVPHILIGAALGGVIGGVGGFLGSAVSQALSGEDFDVKKALGSAANNAIVGAVRGTMISSGVGIGTMLASDFVSGTIGNAVEQQIVKNRVDIGESITSGLINAASGAAFGNSPLRSARDAFFRGGRAGATTAAINNLSNALRGNNQGYAGNRTVSVPSTRAVSWQSPFMRERDPKTLCDSPSPFEGTLGYHSGYQTGKGAQNRNGFSLGSFVKDTAVGFLTGGLSSVAFYGAGKAVEALQNSVRSVHKSGTASVAKPNQGQGFSNKGYNPQLGERTFEGYVNNNVPRDVETKLYTQSSGFNSNPKNDGHFKRFGTEPNQHGIVGAHVHQPTRNVNPNNGIITGKPGSKTKNGGVTVPGAKDVKQLYDYLNNGKYH